MTPFHDYRRPRVVVGFVCLLAGFSVSTQNFTKASRTVVFTCVCGYDSLVCRGGGGGGKGSRQWQRSLAGQHEFQTHVDPCSKLGRVRAGSSAARAWLVLPPLAWITPPPPLTPRHTRDWVDGNGRVWGGWCLQAVCPPSPKVFQCFWCFTSFWMNWIYFWLPSFSQYKESL